MIQFQTAGRTIAFLFVVVILILLSACGPVGVPTTDVAERHPFSLDVVGEDGTQVSWEGYTDGYRPGASETMHLAVRNETDQPWRGRLCVQLLEPRPSAAVFPLTERDFTLEPGMGFDDTVTVVLPDDLPTGIYGLTLVVHEPTGPIVDVIAIEVGAVEEDRPRDAWSSEVALDACAPPPADADTDPAESLVALARADLAQRLDLAAEHIEVRRVMPTQFPDASLGVPAPDTDYAQVVTSGYIIDLAVAEQVFRYHAGGERVVAVPDEEDQPPGGQITIEGVEVTTADVVVHGTSTLPDGTCVATELWADGVSLPWWPADACAPVRQGAWEFVVPLDARQSLEPGVQYMVRAYQPGGPNIVTTFPFDLDAPPPPSKQPTRDPIPLVPDVTETEQ